MAIQDDGFKAFADGVARDANPHPADTQDAAAWYEGWDYGHNSKAQLDNPTVQPQALLDEHVYTQEATTDPRVTHVAMTQAEEEAAAGGDAAPALVDPPIVSEDAGVLHCTTGNWNGEPTSYAYAWHVDGVQEGTDANMFTPDVSLAGKSATCTVSATNAHGTTTAPVSNAVVIA